MINLTIPLKKLADYVVALHYHIRRFERRVYDLRGRMLLVVSLLSTDDRGV
jgi:hypothetical protein